MLEDYSIDGGRQFDWGKASSDYAKYRDIYPSEFYRKILKLGVCTRGQHILDLGTGTGVLPRGMYEYGAKFTGTDISEEQIMAAKDLAKASGMDIALLCMPAEGIDFPDGSFDAITACQCFFYFDHYMLEPKIKRMLRPNGRLAVMYMAWLPGEDEIAGASETLVLEFNPSWSGCAETRHPIFIPDVYAGDFEVENSVVFDLRVPFTRESWNGRMKACRGIGASLTQNEVARFEQQHLALLKSIAPDRFEVLHYAAITVLRLA